MTSKHHGLRHPEARAHFDRIRGRLHAAYPAAFAADGGARQPLAIGIYAAIRAAMPDLRARELSWFLWNWTTRPRYLRAVQAAAVRVNLDGSPAGPVDDVAKARAAEALVLVEARLAARVVMPKPGNGTNDSASPARRQRGAAHPRPAPGRHLLAGAAQASR